MQRFDVVRLGEMLDEAYQKQGREPSDRAKKSFAPSGIGYGAGTCPRQWHYAFTGGVIREDKADSPGIANMAYGTDAHTRLQKVFEDAGVLVEAERPVSTGTWAEDEEGVKRGVFSDDDEYAPIFGFVDLIINWQGEEAVGEIKTTTQESFISKRSKNAPAGYHLLQVLIYMKVLKKDKGFLIYENKNNQQLLILPVTWNVANKKLADDAFDWMRAVYDNWKAGSLPTRPFNSEKSPACKGCAFKTHCWSDENDGTVTLPVLDVPK
jgi:CRISPR/Cas system-associated exonuclease Cas4 (RecB family)